MLSEFEHTRVELRDHCYVHNFRHPDTPIALSLPIGQGRGLRDDMANLLRDLLRDIPAVYESQRYQRQRRLTVEHFQERQKSILQDFERKVKDHGFDLVQVQVGGIMRPADAGRDYHQYGLGYKYGPGNLPAAFALAQSV